MKADFEIGGYWGNLIGWMVDDWDKVDLNKDTLRVYGFKSNLPKKGQTILGHFKRSDIVFKIVKIEYKDDPPDMFFAEVKMIEREMKEN